MKCEQLVGVEFLKKLNLVRKFITSDKGVSKQILYYLQNCLTFCPLMTCGFSSRLENFLVLKKLPEVWQVETLGLNDVLRAATVFSLTNFSGS